MSHYSVVRIETAKQQILKGDRWHRPERKASTINDWTPADEAALVKIIRDFDVPKNGTPTHQALNEAIDNVRFSGGQNYVNCNLSGLIVVNSQDGSVHYREFTKQWGHES
jgi:hypothetical protein